MPREKTPQQTKISIIMPAYREERTIIQDLSNLEKTLHQIRLPYEIICVVDGSPDRTLEKARQVKSKRITIYSYSKNMGKGHAIRYGMARAKGDYVGFIDSGMEVDPNGISMLLEHMEWYKADIIVGSKRHPASILKYPFYRKIISGIYQLFIRFFAGLNVRDTQVGLKLYKRRVLKKILPRLLVKRYAFDLEMLAVAYYLGFTRIYEAPIKLKFSFDAVNHSATLKHMWNAFIDTLAIIYRLRITHYYDYSNRDNWPRSE